MGDIDQPDMRILQLHNHYGSHSGETTVLDVHEALLKSNGHQVFRCTRSSTELDSMPFGKIKAFFTALYNPASIRDINRILKEFSPDIVHIHNLYPLLSPSLLPAVRKAGVPVVMTVHNYRLVCPNGLFYNKEGICERCASGKEWNCFTHNCEESLPKSLGYALRNAWARLFGYYTENVDAFLCLTEFQKRKLVENGFPADKCHVLPNFAEQESAVSQDISSFDKRRGVFFIGRLNRQKGVDIILEAAQQCPSVSFTLAGSSDTSFIDTESLPPNVSWLGVIGEDEKIQAFRNAVALIFTSRSYEGFPMVFLEAMQHMMPVIAPNLAGYPEIIRDGINGWLFSPGDAADLAKIINKLYDKPELLRIAGQNGREILMNEYSSEVWYREYLRIATSLLHQSKRNSSFFQ